MWCAVYTLEILLLGTPSYSALLPGHSTLLVVLSDGVPIDMACEWVASFHGPPSVKVQLPANESSLFTLQQGRPLQPFTFRLPLVEASHQSCVPPTPGDTGEGL